MTINSKHTTTEENNALFQDDDNNITTENRTKNTNQDDSAITTTIPQKKSGIFGAQLNLSNTIVGAGIVGLPYAFMRSGFCVGIFLTIFIGCITVKSCNILIQLANYNPHLKARQHQHKVRTYEDLMFQPFGIWGRGIVLFFMFMLSYGCMVAYLLIIKDTIPVVIGFDQGYEPQVVLMLVSSLVMLPVSMQRDMASLEKTSIISIICDVLLIIFIAVRSHISESIADHGGIGQVIEDHAINSEGIFIGLGIISTAMCCQQTVFLLHGSLENSTKHRWWLVTIIAITISTVLSVTIGVTGFLAFMEEVQGNVLNNYQKDSAEANVARSLLAIHMVFTYPMESIIVRHVIVDIFHDGDMDGANPPGTDRTCLERIIFNRRERVTFFIFVIALIPALVFSDIGIVLSITGAVAGSVLAYICPGLAYIGINGDSFLELSCRLLGYNNLSETDDNNIELPIIGDSNLKMTTIIPDSTNYINYINSTCCKPLWWYIFGFPFWSTIAIIGSKGMKHRASLDAETITSSSKSSLPDTPLSIANNNDGDQDLEIPSSWDFFIAIFFVIFGVIAFVLGITENILSILSE